MNKQLTILLLLLFVLVHPMKAHRLNEYLQATRISLNKNSIDLHINLTAGSGIANKILGDIDSDGNGVISEQEQASYIGSILQHITLILDSNIALLRVVSFNFPTEDAIKNGLGDIQLNVTTVLEPAKKSHQLMLKNQQPGAVVYLVNCLLPDDSSISIGSQSRNIDQSVYTVEFTTNNQQHATTTNQPADNFAIVKSYFFHGVQHILTGYDHLLFLLALLLGAAGIWDLAKIITAFTIAHSVTLTLAALGLVNIPGFIIEPLIAVSIVYVALQNIFWPQYATGMTRMGVAFLFGLVHGLGFAGGLLQLMHAMPAAALLYAILGFSIGIEAGNQMVLIPLYTVLQTAKHVTRKVQPKRFAHFRLLASAIVAIAGTYYLYTSLA